jgi:hypothetical protein
MADHAGPKTSAEKYVFIPTKRLVDLFENAGWVPVKVVEERAKAIDKIGYQKHMIRFRSEDSLMQTVEVGKLFHEIGLTNAHTGAASFHIFHALFRVWCSNGATVEDQQFESYKIRHSAYADSMVEDAIRRMLVSAPFLESKINRFTEIEMAPDHQRDFVYRAAKVKYGNDTLFPIWNGMEDVEDRMIEASQHGQSIIDLDLLREPMRDADRSHDGNGEAPNSLWHVFNIAQEKLVEKGGRFKSFAGRINLPMTRGITSIDENMRVNKGLWQLADEYATTRDQ